MGAFWFILGCFTMYAGLQIRSDVQIFDELAKIADRLAAIEDAFFEDDDPDPGVGEEPGEATTVVEFPKREVA